MYVHDLIHNPYLYGTINNLYESLFTFIVMNMSKTLIDGWLEFPVIFLNWKTSAFMLQNLWLAIEILDGTSLHCINSNISRKSWRENERLESALFPPRFSRFLSKQLRWKVKNSQVSEQLEGRLLHPRSQGKQLPYSLFAYI